MKRSLRLIMIAIIFLLAVITIIFVFPVNGNEKAVNTETSNTKEQENREVKSITDKQMYVNLEAFGKLYGYIRYFHPSDEVESFNSDQWNKFVVYGVSQVKYAETEEELKGILEQLFMPIAPTMELYTESQKREEKSNDIKDGSVVAWQHYGVEPMYEYGQSIYKSQRTYAVVENGEYKLDENHLFEEYPELTDRIEMPISPTLFTDIPLVLYMGENGVRGGTEESKADYELLQKRINNISMSTENEDVRFAGVIVSWNVLNHFYP